MKAHLLLAVVACAVALPAAAGPQWEPRQVRRVRVLDAEFRLVRTITERGQLEAFAAWFQRAQEVEEPASGHSWTHRLDVDAPGGGRWLYDATSGDLEVLSKRRARVYRLAPEDHARFAAMLVAGTPPRPGNGPAWRLPTREELGDDWRRESEERYAVAGGDFDGDGRPDVARLMVSTAGDEAALVVSLSRLGEKVIRLEEPAHSVLGVMGIEVLRRGRHDTLCGKRASCRADEPAVLELEADGVDYFMPESSSSVYHLPQGATEFRRVWMSD